MKPAWTSLFEPEPRRWGLRGDPLLWRELDQQLSALPWPESVTELSALVAQAFADLTGQVLTSDEPASLDRYPQGGLSGGLSGGLVSPEFWRETLLPLLEERYRRAGRETDETPV